MFGSSMLIKTKSCPFSCLANVTIVFGMIISRFPNRYLVTGRYLVKSKNMPGLLILPNCFAERIDSNQLIAKVAELPASVHGLNTTMACGFCRTGNGSTKSNIPDFIATY
jgi:hypothetical protein